jgi:hypothetical protein
MLYAQFGRFLPIKCEKIGDFHQLNANKLAISTNSTRKIGDFLENIVMMIFLHNWPSFEAASEFFL